MNFRAQARFLLLLVFFAFWGCVFEYLWGVFVFGGVFALYGYLFRAKRKFIFGSLFNFFLMELSETGDCRPGYMAGFFLFHAGRPTCRHGKLDY